LPQLVARYGRHCFYHPLLTNPLAYVPEARFQLQPVQPE
jgi:hypothetical protein